MLLVRKEKKHGFAVSKLTVLKMATYMNLSDSSLESDLGIPPVSLLPYKSKLIRFFRLPNSFGISPSKLFLYNSLQIKRSPLIQSSCTPLMNYIGKKILELRIDMGAYRYLRFTRRPSSGPREPEMLELPKSLKHLSKSQKTQASKC
jgi:hypothetical protein